MDLKNWPKRVTQKAQNFAEGVIEYVSEKRNLYQLSNELSAANEHLTFLFADLGRLHFHGSAALAGVRDEAEICEDIRLATQDIAQIENAMREFVKTEDTTHDSDAKTSAPASLYCHKCGAPQAADNAFCPKCGTKLSE